MSTAPPRKSAKPRRGADTVSLPLVEVHLGLLGCSHVGRAGPVVGAYRHDGVVAVRRDEPDGTGRGLDAHRRWVQGCQRWACVFSFDDGVYRYQRTQPVTRRALPGVARPLADSVTPMDGRSDRADQPGCSTTSRHGAPLLDRGPQTFGKAQGDSPGAAVFVAECDVERFLGSADAHRAAR